MTRPFDAVLGEDVVVAAAESFFECSGQAFFCNGALVMPCGIACQRRLIRMNVQLFFPDKFGTDRRLPPAGRFCNMSPEVPSPSRGSGCGFRLRSRQLSETMLVPEPPPIFPMLAVVLSCHVALRKLCDCVGGRLDAVDAVLRVKTCMGGFSLDFSL